ncbi:MAG: GFA family protein [Pseudobdellovibrionaceae bacterium]
MNGQCFCGDIKYQINGEILYGEACHCRICQQLSGGPFQIWLKCNAESLIVQGTVKNYHSSENVIRQSCGNCGSHLFSSISTELTKFISLQHLWIILIP